MEGTLQIRCPAGLPYSKADPLTNCSLRKATRASKLVDQGLLPVFLDIEQWIFGERHVKSESRKLRATVYSGFSGYSGCGARLPVAKKHNESAGRACGISFAKGFFDNRESHGIF